MTSAWPEDDSNDPVAGPSFVGRVSNTQDDEADFWTRNDAPGRKQPGGLEILPQEAAEETSLQKLIRHWMNERHAPDILPAQELLLGRLLDHIRKQVRLFSIFLSLGVTANELSAHADHV